MAPADASQRPTFVITTLAAYQTVFWVEVGQQLTEAGQPVAFLSFDDRSTEMLRAANLEVFSGFGGDAPPEGADLAALVEAAGLEDANYWFSHERITFAIRDRAVLQRKFLLYASAIERALTTIAARSPAVLIQELGGFVSVIASRLVARQLGLPTWMIEPAFFRGRLFFLSEQFNALPIAGGSGAPAGEQVREYLAQAIATGTVVIPQKDSHHYQPAFGKVVNWRNVRRLVAKLADQTIRGKRQDFGYNLHHARMHLKMLATSASLAGRYTPLGEVGSFVYYPLHVPADVALTLRSPEYFDQLALIDFIARTVPATHRVAIKEHPAMIGAIDGRRLRGLLQRHDNLVLLPPGTNNYKVLAAADAVVSVNSKSGAEAPLLGKPVLVLGDAFYRPSGLCRPVDRLADLPVALKEALSASGPNREQVESYLQEVWNRSLPGELYVAEPASVATFTRSLRQAVAPAAAPA